MVLIISEYKKIKNKEEEIKNSDLPLTEKFSCPKIRKVQFFRLGVDPCQTSPALGRNAA